MNKRLIFAGIATGIAFTALGTVPASATAGPPHGEISVVDEVITPGQKVTIRAVCIYGEFTSSEISSPVLTAPPLSRKEGDLWTTPMTVQGTVSSDAAPGVYPISFTCAEKWTGEFTVVAAEEPPAPPSGEEPAPNAPPQVPVRPKGAADTGSLDPAPVQGPDGAVVALGGMALLAAGGLGIAAHRRRQRT